MSAPVFPVLIGLSYPVQREPTWSTDREQAFSGQDAAFPNWSYPRYKYTLVFTYLGNDLVKNTDWRTLLGFYNQIMASAGGLFQFNDPEDCTATAQRFGTGDGATQQFQLVRTLGGFAEPVFCPLTCQASVNGTVVSGSFDATGKFTFTSPPAAGTALTWTGTFNWYSRFTDDSVAFSNFLEAFWELKTMAFMTVKLLGDS